MSKKYVPKEVAVQIHEKAKPFIEWLQQAEEEESDDEDDVTIEYDDRVGSSGQKHIKAVNTKPVEDPNLKDDIDEDLNIDEI